MNQPSSFNDMDALFGSMGASPDGIGRPFGAIDTSPPVIIETQTQNPVVKTLKVAYALAGVAGAALGAYHGYKRNDSVGWAIGWSVLGSLFPVIVIPVAFAQGLGKREGRR